MRIEVNKDYVIDYTSVQSVMQTVSEMGASADGLARVYKLIDTLTYHTVHSCGAGYEDRRHLRNCISARNRQRTARRQRLHSLPF